MRKFITFVGKCVVGTLVVLVTFVGTCIAFSAIATAATQ